MKIHIIVKYFQIVKKNSSFLNPKIVNIIVEYPQIVKFFFFFKSQNCEIHIIVKYPQIVKIYNVVKNQSVYTLHCIQLMCCIACNNNNMAAAFIFALQNYV